MALGCFWWCCFVRDPRCVIAGETLCGDSVTFGRSEPLESMGSFSSPLLVRTTTSNRGSQRYSTLVRLFFSGCADDRSSFLRTGGAQRISPQGGAPVFDSWEMEPRHTGACCEHGAGQRGSPFCRRELGSNVKRLKSRLRGRLLAPLFANENCVLSPFSLGLLAFRDEQSPPPTSPF